MSYSNTCMAHAAGVSVSRMGLCSEPPAIIDETVGIVESQVTVSPDEDGNNATSTTTSSVPNVLVPGSLLSTSLPTIGDTWLEQNDTRVYGERKRLKVDGVIARATLLKFNLTSLADITSVKEIVGMSLKLFSLTDGPFGGKIDLLGEDCNDWDEYAVSWVNAPDCVFQSNSKLVGNFENDIVQYEWNEAALFTVLDDDEFLPELITLRVTSHYADGITYASRENVTAVPELVVYYTLPVPTASPTTDAPTPFVSSSPTKSLAPTEERVPSQTPTKSPTLIPTVSYYLRFNISIFIY